MAALNDVWPSLSYTVAQETNRTLHCVNKTIIFDKVRMFLFKFGRDTFYYLIT